LVTDFIAQSQVHIRNAQAAHKTEKEFFLREREDLSMRSSSGAARNSPQLSSRSSRHGTWGANELPNLRSNNFGTIYRSGAVNGMVVSEIWG
jgi:hypothetical protein